ncbi:MAG: DUF4190 domain-containing protein [Verrucomicrobiales bacterium]|nr:DUF4190 domain-containing protein [Verrucomicrobiales bacterium]
MTPFSKLALASFILGALSFITGILAIPAIFCGHAALKNIRNSTTRIKGTDLSKAGLSMAYFALIVWSSVILFFYSLQYAHSQRMAHGFDLNRALQLRSAITSYYFEYGKYPASTEDVESIEILSNFKLMNVLMATEKKALAAQLNPKNIIFFAGKKAELSDNGKYSNGTHIDASGYANLYDSWGNYFHVKIHFDRSPQKLTPFQSSPSPSNKNSQAILVWSAGKDQISGTDDDIKSW